jgi:mRNA interferase MazF
MRRYSKNDIVLVRYPFSDLSSSKVRPAIVVNGLHPSRDLLIVPLTRQTKSLYPGEFQLTAWSKSGL